MTGYIRDGYTDWNEELGIAPRSFEDFSAASKKAKIVERINRLEKEAAEDPLSDFLANEFVSEHSFSREDAITLAGQELNFLAGLAMPEVFKFLFPPVMLSIWQLLVQLSDKENDFSNLALGIPRGHAKTTLMKLFVLYCILFSKKNFILITASTATMAENIIADIFDMLEEPNIVALFGDWKLGEETKTNRADLKKFGFRGRNIIVAAIGASGSLRGLNIKNARPDVMIFEDIQTRECADSKQQSDTLERWMIGTAMKAKSPSGCLFIFCGNMYPTEYSILKRLKTNATWIKFISGAILADGRALWPELRSYESLIEEFDNDIAAGHPEIFFSEVLNDTEAGTNNTVDFSKIPAWKWGEYEQPQGKFIIIDPSSDKTHSDLVAIGYFEVYDETPALREVIEERLSPGNIIRKALVLALRTGTRIIAVESTSFQYSLLYWFEQICNELGIVGITAVDVYPGMVSKNYRISVMCKGLTAGEIILHPSIRSQVTHQIANWNPLKRNNVDNVLDLLTYSPKVISTYGAMIASDFGAEMQEVNGAVVDEDAVMF